MDGIGNDDDSNGLALGLGLGLGLGIPAALLCCYLLLALQRRSKTHGRPKLRTSAPLPVADRA